MSSAHARDAQKMLLGAGPEGQDTPGWDLADDSDRCAFCGQCLGVYMNGRNLCSCGRRLGLVGALSPRGTVHPSLHLQFHFPMTPLPPAPRKVICPWVDVQKYQNRLDFCRFSSNRGQANVRRCQGGGKEGGDPQSLGRRQGCAFGRQPTSRLAYMYVKPLEAST